MYLNINPPKERLLNKPPNEISVTSLEPILGKRYHAENVGEVEVYVSEIDSKAKISRAVLKIAKLFPDPNLLHLKRVKPPDAECNISRIIVSRVGDEVFRQNVDHHLTQLELSASEVRKVPAEAPLTRQQFDNSRKLWPTNFHENKYGEIFNNTERQNISIIIKELITMGTACGGADVTAVYDKWDKIAIATDKRSDHPLRHSVMNAVDKVAAGQGGGVWSSEYSPTEIGAASSPGHVVPYLCTSYDVFTTSEPCIMCTMSLIHSRIKRLFFVDNLPGESCCPPDKALNEMEVHVSSQLNHHFEAWRVKVAID